MEAKVSTWVWILFALHSTCDGATLGRRWREHLPNFAPEDKDASSLAQNGLSLTQRRTKEDPQSSRQLRSRQISVQPRFHPMPNSGVSPKKASDAKTPAQSHKREDHEQVDHRHAAQVIDDNEKDPIRVQYESSTKEPIQSQSHEDNGNDGLGYSLCLIGAVAFNMSLLYLINHEDVGMIAATWQVLSMTISIFSSVLAYVTIREICVDWLEGVYIRVLASLLLFLCIYVINEGVLYVLKAPEHAGALHAGAAVACHILGFAASYTFGDLQKAAVFGATLWGNLAVVLLAILALGLCAVVARRVHLFVDHMHTDKREHLADLNWEKETELMENEAMALCIGYLVVMAIALALSGSHPTSTIGEVPENITQWHATAMLLCAFMFAGLNALGAYGVTWIMARRGLTTVDVLNFETYAQEEVVPLDLRATMILHNALGVAMAWCMLLWMEWQVHALGFGGPRSAFSMLCGLLLTLLTFMLIFVLEWVAEHIHTSGIVDPERIVRSYCLTLGIVVGFAWERAFHVSIHDIAHALPFGAQTQDYLTWVMAGLLILIVTPAWAMYVFPMVEVSKDIMQEKYNKDHADEDSQRMTSSHSHSAMGHEDGSKKEDADQQYLRRMSSSEAHMRAALSRQSSKDSSGSNPQQR